MEPRTHVPRPTVLMAVAATGVVAVVAAVALPARADRPAEPDPASAARVWGPIRNLTGLSPVAWTPRVVVDSHGTAVAVWVQGSWDSRRVYAAARPAGGEWGTPTRVPGTRNASELRLGIDTADELVLVWTRGRRVLAERRPAGGGWTAPVTLHTTPSGSATGTYPAYLQLSVNASGRAIVAWETVDDDADAVYAPSRAQAVIGRQGGAWGRTATLTGPIGTSYRPEVVMGPDGRATAVWSQLRKAGSRVVTSSHERGTGWTPPLRLSPRRSDAGVPRIASTDGGELAVVWSSEGDRRGLSVRRWRPGEGWLGRTVLPLERRAGWYAVGLGDDGTATIGWARWESRVRIVDQTPGGRWGPVTRIAGARPHYYGLEVAVNAAGDAVLVWETLAGGDHPVQAATRTAGGPWGAATDLSVRPGDDGGSSVALEPDGDAVVVWSHTRGAADDDARIQARSYALP